MGSIWQDIRYGLRTLLKARGFTAAAVLALALGIGINTAIFSIVNGILLRPLPYADPSRLVSLAEVNPAEGPDPYPVSAPNYADWAGQARSFEGLAAYRAGSSASFSLASGGGPEWVQGVGVSAGLFPVLGVNPSLGRFFQPDEDAPGSNTVVILSHGLWQRRFGADPDIVGKALTLSGKSYSVVGVMPAGFEFPVQPSKAELWVPLALGKDDLAEEMRGMHKLSVVGRLRPGADLEGARAEMNTVSARLQQQYPETNTGKSAHVVSLHEHVVGNIRTPLLLLLGAVGCVLLIACANVANLLLARATVRQKEVALRTALGASRLRVVRQLLTESAVLALLGGALGLLFAALATELLVAVSPADIPRLGAVGIDARVLAFTLAVSLLTGVVFGLAPAVQSSKADLNEMLKEGGGKGSAGGGRGRVRSALVVSEVALALLLLIGAGLLIKSFMLLQQSDPGFDGRNVLTVRVPLPESKYSEPPKARAFYQSLLERVKALPEVQHAAVTTSIPLTGWNTVFGFEIPGRPAPPPGKTLEAEFIAVSPEYHQAMGIRLLRGRHFSDHDRKEAPGVVIVNEAMARRHWPGEDALGQQIRIGPAARQIVGVVADVKQEGLAAEATEQMYAPVNQVPSPPSKTLVVRSSSDPTGLVAAIRRAVLEVDPEQPTTNVRTMEQVTAQSIAQPRLYMTLLGVFGAVALLLAAIGIYSVLAYSVTQRTRELGIRMALGARPLEIVRLVVSQGMLLTGAGIALGLAAAYLLSRTLSSLVYGISPTDATIFAAVPAALGAVALVACYIPARRATRISPVTALRHE